MNKENKKESEASTRRSIIILSFFISLLGHFIFLNFLSSNKVAKNLNQLGEKRTRKIKVFLKRQKVRKQIVESKESESKKRAKDSTFLGKRTQMFERETVARNTGVFKNSGQGQKKGQQKKISFSDLAAPKSIKRKKEDRKGKRKLWKQKKSLSRLSSLRPKSAQVENQSPSASNDFIEDIPLGDMTKLNTVEYKYYGFYHRIKRKLEQYWGSSIQEKAHLLWKSGRRMPASENKITSLEVTIDDRGRIVHVHVKGSSGVRELDDAAIESFNRAGPFPNPPRGMVKNGLARIEWGFVVKS